MTYDIIIIGGGPAGLTAALYARRANKTALVIEKSTFGGQITFSPNVENIPGFESVTGNEFAEKLVGQVLAQGADVEYAEALRVEQGAPLTVVTDSGAFTGHALILATGAKHRLLGLAHEEEFIGNGISFCAVCDGAFFKDGTVAVIGGGNSALQEALELANLAKKVIIVQNLDFLTGEGKLCEQIKSKENIEVILGTTVQAIRGSNTFTGITVRRESDGATTDLALDGMFVAIGLVPQNEPFADLISLDARGYANYGEDCTTETAGIFVAGDCRRKHIRQVTTAAADGAVAALAACRYLDARKA